MLSFAVYGPRQQHGSPHESCMSLRLLAETMGVEKRKRKPRTRTPRERTRRPSSSKSGVSSTAAADADAAPPKPTYLEIRKERRASKAIPARTTARRKTVAFGKLSLLAATRPLHAADSPSEPRRRHTSAPPTHTHTSTLTRHGPSPRSCCSSDPVATPPSRLSLHVAET